MDLGAAGRLPALLRAPDVADTEKLHLSGLSQFYKIVWCHDMP
jgi:hypothetical protein